MVPHACTLASAVLGTALLRLKIRLIISLGLTRLSMTYVANTKY